MSRSKRRPYIGIARAKPAEVKKWKRDTNRAIRKEEEIPSGGYFKKIVDSWNHPTDGRQYLDEPKYRRK